MVLEDKLKSGFLSRIGRRVAPYFLGLGLLAFGCGDGGSVKPGCLKDSDCKGNRICLEGVCVEGGEPKEDLYVPKEDIVSDNYQPNCKSHAEKVCSGDELWWYDSCGNPENQIEKCKSGCSYGMCLGQPPACETEIDCPDGEDCFEGECQEYSCISHDSTICSGKNLYWQDSCGNRENKIETCDYKCIDGECFDEPPTYCETHFDCPDDDGCSPEGMCLENFCDTYYGSYFDCYNNNVWEFDSQCDKPITMATDCGDYDCKVVCGGKGCLAGCDTDTCWGLAQCFGECGDFNSQNCVDFCYPGISDQSIFLWEDLMLCILYDADCLDSPNFQQCFTDAAQNQCYDLWVNCTADGQFWGVNDT